MIIAEQIRTKITEAIQQSGITLSVIARKINVSVQTVSCYVHGKKMPALDTFANLCAVLDLDANDILCIEDCRIKGESSYTKS